MTRIVRRPRRGVPDQQTLERYIEFEKTLADVTLGLARFLEEKKRHGYQFLYQAEKVMRQTIQRLGARQFAPATEHQRQALVLLVKARDALRFAFRKSLFGGELRRFDREQVQKLRKPKDDDDSAAVLADKLSQLAKQEQFVYQTLGGVPEEGLNGNAPDSSSKGTGTSAETRQPAQQQSAGREAATSQQRAEQTGRADRRGHGQKRSARQTQPRGGKPLNRTELQRRQYEIVLDAYEAQRTMELLRGMTELARRRMTRSVQQAEAVSGGVARGDTDQAREAAGRASDLFRELARQVRALGAGDAAERIAAARDLAAQLADRQRDLARRLAPSPVPGSPTQSGVRETDQADGKPANGSRSQRKVAGQQRGQQTGRQGQSQRADQQAGSSRGSGKAGQTSKGTSGRGRGNPADSAARLTEAVRTVQDVVDALAREADNGAELSEQLTVLADRASLDAAAEQMELVEQRLRHGRGPAVRNEVQELAERFELLAQELEALHRSIVAPRLSQLVQLEQQAAQLRERLMQLTTDVEITQWHLDAQRLIDRLEAAGAGGTAVEALVEAMRRAGWGGARQRWGWQQVVTSVDSGYHYAAPSAYHQNLSIVIKDLQRQVRELLLRDLMAARDEPVPPQYEKLVERYFEVLSRQEQGP